MNCLIGGDFAKGILKCCYTTVRGFILHTKSSRFQSSSQNAFTTVIAFGTVANNETPITGSSLHFSKKQGMNYPIKIIHTKSSVSLFIKFNILLISVLLCRSHCSKKARYELPYKNHSYKIISIFIYQI